MIFRVCVKYGMTWSAEVYPSNQQTENASTHMTLNGFCKSMGNLVEQVHGRIPHAKNSDPNSPAYFVEAETLAAAVGKVDRILSVNHILNLKS